MKPVYKVLLGILAVVVLIIAGLVITILVRWDRTFEAPAPEIVASDDPAVIARGEYLAYAAASCAGCHVSAAAKEALAAGEKPPLSGGREFDTPLGVIRAPNITPHDTGIGKRTDGELARILRHAVRADGRAAFPLMEYQDLSDEDLTALISFMRAQEPVDNAVEDHTYSFLGKALMAFVIEPAGPTVDTTERHASAPTAEYGAYLAKNVSGCGHCHTMRDAPGAPYTGEHFAGGFPSPHEKDPENKVIVTPNLTPHPTGIMHGWTEQQFLERMRKGTPTVEGSIMPWASYAKMTDDDLIAIFKFLQTLDPVDNDTQPAVRPL